MIVSPVEQREFWLLPHSHNDIGYSDLQTDVEKKQHKNIRDALALIRQTRGYPEGARFKWNVEILWAVESFLQTCTDEERREFLDAARAEEIGLQALYANNLTGIMRPEELIHLTDYARRLEKEQGLSIPSAMISDIPGMTWSSVSSLAQGGVRWFSSGPNYMPGMPDLGDRVGNSNRAWMDKPFHWIGPSGRDTILYWMAGRGYSWFHNWIIGKAGADTRGPIFDYLRELDEKHYPYEMIQLRYTILGDNGPVDPGLADFVKNWNERYLSPRFRIATSAEMFAEFEKRYGGMLPAYSGDMTPYWEDGAASTARELGMNRKNADRLVQAGTLSAVLGQSTYAAAFADAWRNVLLFSEHTWGAHNSIGEPDGAFAREQWEIKRRFAVDADSTSRSIIDGLTGGGAGDTFDLFNTHSWPVSDLVILPARRIGSGGRVREAGGKSLPSQRLRNGDLAFLASNVPAMGWKRYRIEPGDSRSGDPVQVNPGELSGKNFRILLDQKSGAIGSLRVEGFRYDLAAASSNSGPSGLNALYRVAGLDPAAAVRDSLVRMEIGETGPLVGSLLVESALPGCRSVRKEIRLVAGIDRVDILDRIDREPVRTKESVHIAFPFFLPASNVRLDNGWGSVRPEAQQLPGACRDFFPVNGWVDCSNYAQGVAWLTDEAPLVELGSMVDERGKNRSAGAWKRAAVPFDTIYSYVMNNYWHTNYKADQPGEAVFHYAILPHGPFDEALVVRAGLEMREPLLLARAEPGRPASGSLFGLGAGQIVATSVQASADGKALMIRLYNASTGDASPRFAWKDFRPETIYESDATERPIRPWNSSPIPAHTILTLRCEK